MSESMAFVGGVTVAGLAALLLFKGAGTPMQPNMALPQQIPFMQSQPVMPQQYPGQQQQFVGQAPVNPNDPLRAENEKLKTDLTNLQKENEQLKYQYQQLQFQFQGYVNQVQQQASANAAAAQSPQAQPQPQLPQAQSTTSPWWSSGIVWGVGGIVLTIGGGIVVAGVLSLFSNKERPNRTVQVIHPYPNQTPPLAPVRRAEFLPPRVEVRRAQPAEYEDYQ
jgi:hypothetical protein